MNRSMTNVKLKMINCYPVYQLKVKLYLNNKMNNKISVILTGATGMVGEGVLIECLENPVVEKILVVGRRSCGYSHPKLGEFICSDLQSPYPAEKLAGYDACFFCAGVSSIGMKEDEFTKLTYDMTLGFAKTFIEQNKDKTPAFCYVSGYGTDGTGKKKAMWSRVKGRTENELIKMFGEKAFMFRPGYMKPLKGQKRILRAYFGWQISFPVMKLFLSKFTCELREVAKAMINCSFKGFEKNILEVKDIISASKRA